MTTRIFVLAFFITLASGFHVPIQHSSPAIITPAQVHALIEDDTAHLLLDVRTIEEFDGPSGHLRGAILIPVQTLVDELDRLSSYRQKTIIVICRSGNRSGYATTLLRDQGFNALNMVGGMIRWDAEGRPVIHTEHH
jgi:rhodanese-related sulfurtransferase